VSGMDFLVLFIHNAGGHSNSVACPPAFMPSINDTNNFMRFPVSGADGNTCRIAQDAFVGGGFEAVGEYASVVQKPRIIPGVWYTLTVIVHQQNAFAFVDDALVAYAMGLPFAGGFVGFMSDGPTITCKEILVTRP
jgi:hypothetical protein